MLTRDLFAVSNTLALFKRIHLL